jgi:hypothetical protein
MAEPGPHTTDFGNYDLLRTSPDPADGPQPSKLNVWWLVIAAVVAVAMVTTYVIVQRQRAATMAAAAKPSRAAVVPAARPLGSEPAAIDVPPLDQSDALVRELVRQLSSHPSIAAWLTSDRLIRNFAAVVSNTADGPTPAVHLRALRPAADFKVVEQNGRFFIDPRSYQRYDAFAAAAASLDPAAVSRLYATLKPRIEEAYQDLGTGMPFDRALELAIVALLRTPAVADPIAVRPVGGTGYAFVDPKLEDLTPAQKQLLRTGRNNVLSIQRSLRAIALALGIPSERLPAAAVQ